MSSRICWPTTKNLLPIRRSSRVACGARTGIYAIPCIPVNSLEHTWLQNTGGHSAPSSHFVLCVGSNNPHTSWQYCTAISLRARTTSKPRREPRCYFVSGPYSDQKSEAPFHLVVKGKIYFCVGYLLHLMRVTLERMVGTLKPTVACFFTTC